MLAIPRRLSTNAVVQQLALFIFSEHARLMNTEVFTEGFTEVLPVNLPVRITD